MANFLTKYEQSNYKHDMQFYYSNHNLSFSVFLEAILTSVLYRKVVFKISSISVMIKFTI